ncbi:MAG TPA: ATP-binding protein, partial [Holophagaceae bacterium]
QAQKLESLGILAGGVAHDMNNVLAAILGIASSLKEKMAPSSPDGHSLETVMQACTRGRGVVKGLLYFARKDLQEECAIDLNALVRDLVQLLGFTTLKRFSLETDLEAGLGSLRGDEGAISHALMNLCVNSMDAMEEGGRLTIRTRSLPGGGLELSVADTGAGMPPEVLARAMDPFFTTKPVGKGTGLGLSMVFGTMSAHGGTVELRSRIGQGTEAVLTFPASRVEAPAEPPGVPAPPSAADRHALSILVIDDDELVRESVQIMLEGMGHRPVLASGGQEALDLFGQALSVDLVILDMNMPGMNGAETLVHLQSARPDLPVLIATGYSDENVKALLEGRPKVGSVRKPFSAEELGRKLADLGACPSNR